MQRDSPKYLIMAHGQGISDLHSMISRIPTFPQPIALDFPHFVSHRHLSRNNIICAALYLVFVRRFCLSGIHVEFSTAVLCKCLPRTLYIVSLPNKITKRYFVFVELFFSWRNVLFFYTRVYDYVTKQITNRRAQYIVLVVIQRLYNIHDVYIFDSVVSARVYVSPRQQDPRIILKIVFSAVGRKENRKAPHYSVHLPTARARLRSENARCVHSLHAIFHAHCVSRSYTREQ